MRTYKKDSRIVVSTQNLSDFTDRDGEFVKTFSFTDSHTDIKYNFSTRAYCVWSKINSRCKEGGHYQNRNQSMLGTINNFPSFQDFAQWCQSQPGYNMVDSENRHWALDKDVIGRLYNNDKIYSKDNCCFIPQYINKILSLSTAIRGDLPIGVSLLKNTGKFMSYCKTTGDGKREIFGYFNSPQEAHQEWQIAKVRAIKNAILRYQREHEFNPCVVDALTVRIGRLERDIMQGMETVIL